jgi:WXG100 family type VII secretion target
MSEVSRIDFGRMDGLTALIKTSNEAITAELDKLDREVTALGAAWLGEAESAYRDAHRQWSAALVEMNRVLGEAHAATTGITERHRGAEAKVQALWS